MLIFKQKRAEVVSLQVFERKCIGCERCVDRCRYRVFGMIYKEYRSYATVEYRDRCVGCGRCTWTCPTDAVELITV